MILVTFWANVSPTMFSNIHPLVHDESTPVAARDYDTLENRTIWTGSPSATIYNSSIMPKLLQRRSGPTIRTVISTTVRFKHGLWTEPNRLITSHGGKRPSLNGDRVTCRRVELVLYRLGFCFVSFHKPNRPHGSRLVPMPARTLSRLPLFYHAANSWLAHPNDFRSLRFESKQTERRFI